MGVLSHHITRIGGSLRSRDPASLSAEASSKGKKPDTHHICTHVTDKNDPVPDDAVFQGQFYTSYAPIS